VIRHSCRTIEHPRIQPLPSSYTSISSIPIPISRKTGAHFSAMVHRRRGRQRDYRGGNVVRKHIDDENRTLRTY
jgi:hypothetical protein